MLTSTQRSIMERAGALDAPLLLSHLSFGTSESRLTACDSLVDIGLLRLEMLISDEDGTVRSYVLTDKGYHYLIGLTPLTFPQEHILTMSPEFGDVGYVPLTDEDDADVAVLLALDFIYQPPGEVGYWRTTTGLHWFLGQENIRDAVVYRKSERRARSVANRLRVDQIERDQKTDGTEAFFARLARRLSKEEPS